MVDAADNPKRVCVLGATGSVGTATLQVMRELMATGQQAIAVTALTGGSQADPMIALAREFRPQMIAMANPVAAGRVREAVAGLGIAVGGGENALIEAASLPADWVMAAIVGAAGLAPTCAALAQGAHVALANKESLVCAGPLVLQLAARHGATILPVDSEHNGIFQALTHPSAVEAITLTASGGPFRTWSAAEMAVATPEQAKRHPTWDMGLKISIDSATLMNKGLELIEAGYLFGLNETMVDLVVHPQSIVHALVHYSDGSTLAHLAEPDMRVPIAHALAWPDRCRITAPRLDLGQLARLEFSPIDANRFPGPGLARAALRAGAGATGALNAANEIAVASFIARRIGFLQIADVVADVLDAAIGGHAGLNANSPTSFDEVRTIDAAARSVAEAAVARRAA